MSDLRLRPVMILAVFLQVLGAFAVVVGVGIVAGMGASLAALGIIAFALGYALEQRRSSG